MLAKVLRLLLRLFGLESPHHDTHVDHLDRRSRVAVHRIAEELDDDELRRLAGLSRATRIYPRRRPARRPH